VTVVEDASCSTLPDVMSYFIIDGVSSHEVPHFRGYVGFDAIRMKWCERTEEAKGKGSW
jgi:hypothetical protein